MKFRIAKSRSVAGRGVSRGTLAELARELGLLEGRLAFSHARSAASSAARLEELLERLSSIKSSLNELARD